MACVQIQTANADSEMEEGEIVDELDDLSDISSEEEFLLRQRLQVLENYNNVLERTKAKQISLGSDGTLKVECTIQKVEKNTKPHHKHKKSEHKKQTDKETGKIRGHKKKNTVKKTILSETSEDSDDDYRSKRRKLADAVALDKPKGDTSTLKDRITKMLLSNKTEADDHLHIVGTSERRKSTSDIETCKIIKENETPIINNDISVITVDSSNSSESISSYDNTRQKNVINTEVSIDSGIVEKSYEVINSRESSDEDIELLRQNALQTKSSNKQEKSEPLCTDTKALILSDDEDSDTTELRMICLKSALLKKAIEMKRKQKLQKRLSYSGNFQNEFDLNSCENFTDIESVDMDIGSDVEDKGKDSVTVNTIIFNGNPRSVTISNQNAIEDVEEDEDLLRAKLLTSLSKNLPILVDSDNASHLSDNASAVEQEHSFDKGATDIKQINSMPNQTQTKPYKEESKFIIQLGGSDSEAEHEATKNLTKMHMKLSEQEDFQNKLDIFLKTSRMQVENKITQDDVDRPNAKNPSQKFVAKTMNNLPKPEQIEYKNLVKRMAELEKIKQARQSLLNMETKMSLIKETLKPRNVSYEFAKINAEELEEKIAASRKKIANESAKMLQLKDEAKKLAQKYKIVATELRNIRTAIVINKKRLTVAQKSLNSIQLQHQMLFRSSTNFKHSKPIELPNNRPINKMPIAKLQKENDPVLKNIKNSNNLKAVKVSVVNDLNAETNTHPRLSVQVDITNNKKVVRVPKNYCQGRVVDINYNNSRQDTCPDYNGITITTNAKVIEEKTDIHKCSEQSLKNTQGISNDYRSPLDALKDKSWEQDPNAFLCPYEVGGSCRDPDCKNLHPKVPSTQ